ncbi:VWA domain-containing protein [candidate division KSB1 bacterium]|nr:VWA domain-containing protein [candidate division KSB1 bacterium]
MKYLSCVVGTIAGMLLVNNLATADGLLFVSETKQQARLSRTLVNVKIYDQIALTTVTHEFINPVKTDSVEVVYMFPLPENAAVTDFAIWRGQQFVSFKLVAADTGGGHQNLPGENLDPALQNYLFPNPFIFPTVAKEDTFRVRLSYAALLPYDFGAIKYRFPLYSSQFSAGPLDALAMLVTFSTQRTITGMQTPDYAAGIEQHSPYTATVGYDNANFTPPKDFVIDYTLSQKEVGLFTLTYHDPADTTETAGYFVLLLEPGEVQPSSVLNKYFTFVLDRSGSMLGVKMEQAKAAARFCVEHLNPNDFFNIVDFASDIRVYQNEPVAATAANISQAVSYIDNIQANGGTNANEALLTGLSQTIPGGVNQVVFLTDGLPTVGETNTQRILANVRAANKNNASIFVFGVGDYIGQDLLQALADENHGTASYLKENEPISDIIANFFARISNPVLVDVKLEFDDMQVFDLYPVDLPDIFAGFQQVIAGRNQTFGSTNITLKGRVATADTAIVYPNLIFPAQSTENSFVPKIWAKKKIDYLYARWLKENKPEELKQQIIALSVKYGVLSPFTQFKPPDPTTAVAEGVLVAQLQAAAVFVSDRPTIRLTWHLEGEAAEIAAIEIYRSDRVNGNYARVATLPPSAVAYDDVTAAPSSNWYYRLDILMRNGQRISTSINYQAQAIRLFHLAQNYPNPFSSGARSRLAGNPKTRLEFYLGQRSAVELAVYNIRGEQVKILMKESLPAGQHQAEWDGTNTQGRPVASGIYFYRLRTPEFTGTRTMVLAK